MHETHRPEIIAAMRMVPKAAFVALIFGVLCSLTAYQNVAAEAVVLKRCGQIRDPRGTSTVRVNLTAGRPVSCALARTVMRSYLSRVPRPRRSTSASLMSIRVGGRVWDCSVTREVGAGHQTDFACSKTQPNYTNINAGP